MRPIHLRMARAALGWTLKELGDKAGVNMNTISRYEAGSEILSGTMEKIEVVLRGEGVIFLDEDADYYPAIRIHKEPRVPLIEEPEIRRFTIRSELSKKKPKTAKRSRR